MDKSSQLLKKTYRANMHVRHAKATYFLIYPLFIAYIALLILLMLIIKTSFTQKCFSLFSIILCVFTLYINTMIANTRLEVSSEGVAYYGWNIRMYTPWQNIVGVARVPYPRLGTSTLVNAFLFRSPAILNVSISEGKRRGIAVIEKRWRLFLTPSRSYIHNLPIFADDLLTATDISHHEIATYIRRYAPQVFAESAEQE